MKIVSHFGNTLQDKIAIALSDASYTRAQLGARLGVSRTVLSRALDPLIRDGFVKRTIPEHEATSGRPVQTLSLRKQCAYIVGISIGRHDATGLIVNRAGEQIAFVCEEYTHYDGWENPLSAVLNQLLRWITNHALEKSTIVGTGVALPMSGFQSADVGKLVKIVGSFWQGICIVDNIVAMAALAHSGFDGRDSHESNSNSNTQPKMYVRLSGGVGSCLMWESPIGNIPQVVASEFGHVSVPGWDNLRCHCGNCGCLELVASASALCRKAEVDDLAAFAAKVTQNDELAMRALTDAAEALGFSCAQAAMMLHPASINLGGEVVAALPQIVPLTAIVMRKYFSPAVTWNVPINQIVMDGNCCALGAVSAVQTGVTTMQIKTGSISTGTQL